MVPLQPSRALPRSARRLAAPVAAQAIAASGQVVLLWRGLVTPPRA